jgi:hypothetical protein
MPAASASPPPFPPYGTHLTASVARARRRIRWTAATSALAVASLATTILLLRPFDTHTHGDGNTTEPTDATTTSPSSTASALSTRWAGVWIGTGPGTPRADGRLHPRTDSFKVTLTLHTAAVGELAGKQVSNISEVGTGREVGCTEALELGAVRGTTATFMAVTSHPTDRSDTSLQCETGHLYVVQLTTADTISLGDEGSQSAGAPATLRRSRGTS